VPIVKSEFIWFNDKFVNWDEAKTHVLDHGLHYGTGVFEGIRAYKTLDDNSAVFRLEDHVERLFRSAQMLRILIPYSKKDIRKIIINTVKKNTLKECYITPLVWCGFKELGLHAVGMPINFMVAVWGWGRYLGKGGVRTKISTWIRNNPNSFPSQAKICGGYVNSVFAVLESRALGYDEAIFLDHRGFVSEGPGENIFLVSQGKIFTPPIEASILNGITRDTVITFAQNKGYEVFEANITRNQLYNAEEAFFTGTAAEITPIYEVDDIQIGNGVTGQVTKFIQEEYLSIVRGERQQYTHWLTKI
jgi:branched-chain amino acid aminotransferase